MPESVATIRVVGKDEASGELAKVRKATQDLEKSTDELGKTANSAFPLVGIATAGVAAFGLKSAFAADSLSILRNSASQAFGNDFPKVTLAVDKMSVSLDRSNSDLLQFTTSFQTAFRSVNVGKAQAEDMSLALTELTVNLGKAKGLTDDEAFSAIQSAMRGNTRELTRLNIIMNDATLAEYAHAEGIKQKVGDMNEAQQMALRYSYLMSKSAEIEALAAKNAGGLHDQVETLKGSWHDLMETVGDTGALNIAIGGVKTLEGVVWGLNTAAKSAQRTLSGAADPTMQAQILSQGIVPKGMEGKVAFNTNGSVFFQGSIGGGAADVKGVGSAASDANGKVKDLINSLSGAGSGVGSKTKDETKKAREAMEDLATTYDDATDNIRDALANMEQDHRDRMAGLKEQLKSVEDSIDSMGRKYKQTMDDLSGKEFDAVAKQQEKVNKLKKELASDSFFSAYSQDQAQSALGMLAGVRKNEETGDITRQEQHGFGWSDATVSQLNKVMELQKEQGALDKVLGGRSDKDSLLAGAKIQGGKTDFEKQFDDFGQTREREKAAHIESMKEKEEERTKIQDKMAIEKESHTLQRQEIDLTMQKVQMWHDDYLLKLSNMATVTDKTAKELKKSLEDIQNSLSTAAQLKAMATANVSNGTSDRRDARTPARASGGYVTEGMTLVGEQGPELVSLPHGSRVHTAQQSRQMGRQGNIYIGTINLPQVKNAQDLLRELQLIQAGAA